MHAARLTPDAERPRLSFGTMFKAVVGCAGFAIVIVMVVLDYIGATEAVRPAIASGMAAIAGVIGGFLASRGYHHLTRTRK